MPDTVIDFSDSPIGVNFTTAIWLRTAQPVELWDPNAGYKSVLVTQGTSDSRDDVLYTVGTWAEWDTAFGSLPASFHLTGQSLYFNYLKEVPNNGGYSYAGLDDYGYIVTYSQSIGSFPDIRSYYHDSYLTKADLDADTVRYDDAISSYWSAQDNTPVTGVDLYYKGELIGHITPAQSNFTYNAGLWMDYSTLSIFDSPYSDVIETSPGAWPATVFLSTGNDTVNGYAGTDTVYGGTGTGTINLGDGNDLFQNGSGTYVVHAGSGDDVVAAGTGDGTAYLDDGNDTFAGGPGAWTVYGGNGSDTFDFSDPGQVVAGTVETLDGGSQPADGPSYLPSQPDVLLLPGAPNDYKITTDGLTQTLELKRPGVPVVSFVTSGIELAKFNQNTINIVGLQNTNLFSEMAQLSADIYSSSVSSIITGRSNWEPLSAIELGLEPEGQTVDGANYTLTDGYYQAEWNAGSIPGLGDTAYAEVAVGVVNGVRSLSISFAGTHQATDWLYDFGSFAAYYAKFGPLIDGINRYVADQTNGIQQVLVDGHSLGATMVQFFMDDHHDGNGVSYKALTLALPGIALDPSGGIDPRQIDFIHTSDIVGNLPLTQNGTKVYIDSSAAYFATNEQHAVTSYLADYQDLLSFALDIGSPFAGSAVAKAIVAGATSLSSFYTPQDDRARVDGFFQIALNSSGTVIQSYTADDYVLGSGSDDSIVWNGVDPLTYRVVDGAGGSNELVLPGLQSMWGWSSAGSHWDLSELGGAVGELWHIQKLVFTFASDVTLSGAATSQRALATEASTSLVPVVWLDGRATTVEAPPPGVATYNVVGTSDYVQLGNQDITVTGSDHGDIIMAGTGHQQISGGAGNDIIDGALAGSPATLSLSGGEGDDVVIGSEGADLLGGDDGADTLQGGGGNDKLSGGPGADVLSGGSGSDSFVDTAANLSGDTITDFSAGDLIRITDANIGSFSFSLSGSTLSFTGGSLTLASVPTGHLVAKAAAGGGVQLTLSTAAVHNDFDGDGRSDILWRDAGGTIFNFLGTANGGVVNNGGNSAVTVGADWHVAGTGDFNGDGHVDILWRNDNGTVYDFLGTGGGGYSNNGDNSYVSIATATQIVGIGDFNGDGRADILWRDAGGTIFNFLGAANGGYTNNGGNSAVTVGSDWHVAGTGDFNGDGIDDILWRNDNGTIYDFLGTAGGGYSNNGDNSFVSIASTTQIVGIGDFNGDGRSDILWRDANGTIFDFLGAANGGYTNNGGNSAVTVGSDWHVASVGDFNGDGRSDILWRNDNGTIYDFLGTANGGFTNNGDNSFVSVATTTHIQDPFVHDALV